VKSEEEIMIALGVIDSLGLSEAPVASIVADTLRWVLTDVEVKK
jgi:hypothetical protein